MGAISIAALINWIQIGQQVFSAGQGVWDEIKGVLAAHGIEADTAELDRVISEAQAAKAKEDALIDPPPAA